MVEWLSNPIWQGAGVIVAILFGLIGFYYARQQRFWLYLAGAVLVFIAGLAVGSWAERNAGVNKENITAKEDDALSINEIQFIAYPWARAEVTSEQGWSNLSIVNTSDFGQSYKFDYYLPDSSTQYSGAGLTFQFNEPLDLSTYERVIVNITFDVADGICYLLMYDISNNFQSFPLGVSASNSPGVEIVVEASSQTYKIPLDTYFQNVNRKVIRELACAVDTTNSTGKHGFTINNVFFSRE